MKIGIVVLISLALVGCVAGLVGQAPTEGQQSESAVGGAEQMEPSLLGTLKEAFFAGAEAAKEEAEKAPAYQAGKKTSEGLLELLACLGIGTGSVAGTLATIFGLKKRKSDKVATATVTAVQEARKDPAFQQIFTAAVAAALSKLEMSRADYDAAVKDIKKKCGIESVNPPPASTK